MDRLLTCLFSIAAMQGEQMRLAIAPRLTAIASLTITIALSNPQTTVTRSPLQPSNIQNGAIALPHKP